MALTTPSPVMRTTREPDWTPRQRQVLDLLVRGRTNGEIAAELGISLDGAKWHVSEIITCLGVDSRDEAAEYWRHRNGLRMRFTRVLQAVFGSNLLKIVGATAAAGAFIAASALVVFALQNSGDGSPQAGSPTPPGETTTPAPGSTPPPATPAPGGVDGEVVMDIPVGQFVVVDPVRPAGGTSFIVEKGCWQCDGNATHYERVSFDANGVSTVQVLFAPPVGYVLDGTFDTATGTHYVAVCAVGYCGGVGEISPDALSVLYRSTDDGANWHAIAEYPGLATVGPITAKGPIMIVSGEPNERASLEYLDGSPVMSPVPGYHPYAYRGLGFAWMSDDWKSLLMPDGSPLVSGDLGGHKFDDSSYQFVSLLPDGSGAVVNWWHGDAPAGLVSYTGIFRDGKLEKAFRTGEMVLIGAWLSPQIAVGNMAMEAPAGSGVPGGMASQPVLVNFDTGEIVPLEIYGPLFTELYTGRNGIVGAAIN